MTDSAGPKPTAERRTSWFTVLAAICVVVVVAAACAFALQYSTHLDWGDRSGASVLLSFWDVVIIAVVVAFVWSVLGRLWLSLALVTGVVLLLAGINRTKLGLRLEPLFPSDRDFLSEPGFLVSMVDTSAVVRVVVVVSLIIALMIVIGLLAGRLYPRPRLRRADGRLNRRFLAVRVSVLLVSAGLLVHAANFNEPGNLWRAAYEAQGARWTPWSQMENYRNNGFVGGFLYNMPVTVMDEPDGYDEAAMAEVTKRYEERAAQINEERAASLDDFNVVFVLSESFTDPEWMNGFTLPSNPIPQIQQIMDETLSGRTYTHLYGGGTSTMEFESLTGEPVGLFRSQVSSPYQMFVSEHDAYPSAVGAFSATGHHTIAIHPYNLLMYKRPAVYETLGFDEVIDENTMQSRRRIEGNRYISDAAAFKEVVHHIDRNDDPVFVNLVTMQNHGSYDNFYSDPIDPEMAGNERADEIGQYARGLSHTDQAVTDFLAELSASEEPTIVMFYGDHHPGVYSQEIIDDNEDAALFRTPFFVWSSESNEHQEVPAATPAMFLPLVYEVADAQVPPYVALLDDVRHSVPVLQHARTLDAAGRSVDPEDLDDDASALLDDLRLVQYDFSIGDRHAVDAMWPGATNE